MHVRGGAELTRTGPLPLAGSVCLYTMVEWCREEQTLWTKPLLQQRNGGPVAEAEAAERRAAAAAQQVCPLVRSAALPPLARLIIAVRTAI